MAHCQTRSENKFVINMSSDDTSVAVLEVHEDPQSPIANLNTKAQLHYHEKVTARNKQHGGIHPLVAAESHQKNLARLVDQAVGRLPCRHEGGKKPDFITVTRGPGMRSCLQTGLDTAKGLAAAWQIPFIGVHHMQAHALTPRLMSSLEMRWEDALPLQPSFPFLSLLASGGHTLLLSSESLCEHSVLAFTTDIAIGDAIDKMAREILPQSLISEQGNSIVYGRLLEEFAFPQSVNLDKDRNGINYNYHPPGTRARKMESQLQAYDWELPVPLNNSGCGQNENRHRQFSFSGLDSSVRRICQRKREAEESNADAFPDEERRHLAREAQRIAFEHLASRVVIALKQQSASYSVTPNHMRDLRSTLSEPNLTPSTLVLSGGVASNAFLRHLLPRYLSARGFPAVNLVCPPLEFCTDNAAMIAWAGVEMWRAGWVSAWDITSKKRWGMDSRDEDGGILGAEGWVRRENFGT